MTNPTYPLVDASESVQRSVTQASSGRRAYPRARGGLRVVIALWLTLLAGAGFGLLEQETGPLPVSLVFLLLSVAAGSVLGPGRGQAASWAALSFGVTACVALFCQIMSIWIYGAKMTTSDAELFYRLARRGTSAVGTLDHIRWDADSPLSVYLWQALYDVAYRFGIGNGPWLGILLNASVVAVSAGISVSAARLLFARDFGRANTVGLLGVCCGMYWLFGAMFLRDWSPLLLNVLALYAGLLALTGRTLWSVLVAGGIFAAVLVAMPWVRVENTPFIWIVAALAALSVSIEGQGLRRAAIAIIGISVLALVLRPHVDPVAFEFNQDVERYATLAREQSGGEGFGYRFVVSQPAYIRIVTGSLLLNASPLPLWTGLFFERSEYHFLKSLHGFLIAGLAPWVALGAGLAAAKVWRGEARSAPFTFVFFYWAAGMVAVALTSGETRHYGQFLPAVFLLAALPSRSDAGVRRWWRWLAVCWYVLLALAHLILIVRTIRS